MENLEILLPKLFDEFIAEFELDADGSLNDMFFEIFCTGFEAALHFVDAINEEENEEGTVEADTGSEEE